MSNLSSPTTHAGLKKRSSGAGRKRIGNAAMSIFCAMRWTITTQGRRRCLQELRVDLRPARHPETQRDLSAWIGKCKPSTRSWSIGSEANIIETLTFYRRAHHKHLKEHQHAGTAHQTGRSSAEPWSCASSRTPSLSARLIHLFKTTNLAPEPLSERRSRGTEKS